MLLKTFHNNRLATLALVPLIMLALWSRFFVIDIVHLTIHDNPSMPLWETVVVPVFGYSVITAVLLTFALALVTGLSVNRVMSKHSLLSKQSLLPLFIFALLAGAFLSVQTLNPVWFFTLFFVLAIERLFGSVNHPNPIARCFDASLMVGIGSLFFAKGVFLYPLLIMIMGILRVASYRTIVASFIGFIFPFIISYAWFFLDDKGSDFLSLVKENLISNPGQYNHTLFSRLYLGCIILFNGFALITIVRFMGTQKIITRRYFRVFIWILLIVSTGVLLPFFSIELFPVAIVASTVHLSYCIDKISRAWLKESFLWLLVILTVAGQLVFL